MAVSLTRLHKKRPKRLTFSEEKGWSCRWLFSQGRVYLLILASPSLAEGPPWLQVVYSSHSSHVHLFRNSLLKLIASFFVCFFLSGHNIFWSALVLGTRVLCTQDRLMLHCRICTFWPLRWMLMGLERLLGNPAGATEGGCFCKPVLENSSSSRQGIWCERVKLLQHGNKTISRSK